MIEDVVSILNTLATAPNGSEPVVIEENREFIGQTAVEGELSAAYNRFLAVLDDAIARVEREWEPPVFVGTGWDEGYPEWTDALTIAVWRKSDRDVFLAFRHPDHESALAIVAGVHSRDIGDDDDRVERLQ